MKISIAILAAAAVSSTNAASPQRRRIQNIHNSAVVNAEEEYDVYLGLSKTKEEKNSVFGRELQEGEGEEETGESEMPTCKIRFFLYHCNDTQDIIIKFICTHIIYSSHIIS